MTASIRVLIVDDHPVVREGLRALLGSFDDLEVVGSATSGPQAVREAVLLQPDVVVMDVAMPDGDGISATRELSTVAPGVAVLVLTMFDTDESVAAALRAGARGYVLKGAGQAELERAVRAAAAGETILGAGVAAGSLRATRKGSAESRSRFAALTPREAEVLDAIAAGLSNGAIAERLRMAPKTVGNHISNIFVKIGVADRSTAIVRARDAGFGRGG